MHYRGLQAIANRLHEKLLDSEYLVHCFASRINHLLSCKLTFESGKLLVIRNGAEGESLIVEDRNVEEMNLDEYGEIKLMSSLTYDPAESRPCVGRCFHRCTILMDSRDQIRAIELDFEGRSIGFYNRDDDLRVAGSIEDVSAPDGARLVAIP